VITNFHLAARLKMIATSHAVLHCADGQQYGAPGTTIKEVLPSPPNMTTADRLRQQQNHFHLAFTLLKPLRSFTSHSAVCLAFLEQRV
jgi:hypothetical protein